MYHISDTDCENRNIIIIVTNILIYRLSTSNNYMYQISDTECEKRNVTISSR